MLDRRTAIEAIETALGRAPVVVLTGPRRCGKITLARRFKLSDRVEVVQLSVLSSGEALFR